MAEKAVIDRIEEGLAVLLVGTDERELYIPLERLAPSLQAGDWLRVEIQDGAVIRAEKDPGETEHRRERVRAKLRHLLNKSPK